MDSSEIINEDIILETAYNTLYKPNRQDLERNIILIDEFATRLDMTRDMLGSYILGWFELKYREERRIENAD